MGSRISTLSKEGSTPLLPELLECILDFLEDDKQTLAACTVVSLSWLQPSHRRLYRKISRMLHKGEHDAVAFLRDLQDRPHVSRFIQVLEFSAANQVLCTRHTLPAILRQLPELRELKLWGLYNDCSCEAVQYEYKTTSLQLFKLRRLELNRLAHSSIPSFLSLLGLFSDIQILLITFDAVAYLRASTLLQQGLSSLLPPGSIPQHLRIHSLEIHMSTAATSALILFHILPSTPSADALQTLETSFDGGAQLRICAELIRCCTNLRRVNLGQWLTFNAADHEAWDTIDLSSCHNLQTCILRPTICDYEDMEEVIESKLQQNRSIIGVLSRLPPTVDFVTIMVQSPTSQLETLRTCYDWNQVRDIMLKMNAAQTITFGLQGVDSSPTFAECKDFILNKTSDNDIGAKCSIQVVCVDSYM